VPGSNLCLDSSVMTGFFLIFLIPSR
jgi:hypothetical protein